MARNSSRLRSLLDGNLRPRLISAAIGLPLIAAAILVGVPLFAALIALALAVALGEIAVIVGINPRSALFIVAEATVGAIIGAAAHPSLPVFTPLIIGTLAVAGVATIAAVQTIPTPDPDQLKRVVLHALTMIGGFLYLAIPGATFIFVRAADQGDRWVLLAMLAVMSADAAAYAGGRLLGRRQLAPSVSPNKTVEGAISGWLGGLGATIALDQILDLDAELWPLIILAVVLPLVSQLGDLVESLFKRAMDVKDSSNLIPGHGGVLDRLDSLLFGLPVVYFFLQWTT